MKLYDSLGPNPRLVRMFLLEKNVTVPAEQVDIMGGANRKPPYTDKNSAGQMPSLELDNGFVLGETIAICEYLEEKHPKPALIGATPEERAETRMWLRRLELGITEPGANGFRFAEGLAMFKDRLHTIPEAAAGLKAGGLGLCAKRAAARPRNARGAFRGGATALSRRGRRAASALGRLSTATGRVRILAGSALQAARSRYLSA